MFKIKDLMIKVAPIDQNLGSPMWCGICTGSASCDGCTFHTPCGGFWSGLMIAPQNIAAENLPLLKEQLKAQLANGGGGRKAVGSSELAAG